MSGHRDSDHRAASLRVTVLWTRQGGCCDKLNASWHQPDFMWTSQPQHGVRATGKAKRSGPAPSSQLPPPEPPGLRCRPVWMRAGAAGGNWSQGDTQPQLEILREQTPESQREQKQPETGLEEHPSIYLPTVKQSARAAPGHVQGHGLLTNGERGPSF